MKAVSSSSAALMTNPIRPIVMNVRGKARVRTIGPIRPLTRPKISDRTMIPEELAVVLHHVEAGVLGQDLGQDVERDGRDDRADDEASQRDASERCATRPSATVAATMAVDDAEEGRPAGMSRSRDRTARSAVEALGEGGLDRRPLPAR